MQSILFVCLGNICRSPAAEGVLRHLSQEAGINLKVASCGLGDWHAGQLPDERMRKTAEARGIVLVSRAQAFQRQFFDEFDYIFAADHAVMNELRQWAKTPQQKAKIHLMTRYSATYHDEEIPDPFYFDLGHFELVMDMLEDACEGLLEHLKSDDNR